MEVAVELDDAPVVARLALDGGVRDGKLVLDTDVALALVLLLVAGEALGQPEVAESLRAFDVDL